MDNEHLHNYPPSPDQDMAKKSRKLSLRDQLNDQIENPPQSDDAFLGYAADHPEVVAIPLEEISPNPDQPRKHFDEETLRELADSIQEQGLINPIQVRPASGKGYIIVAGERRFRAHQILGKETIYAFLTTADADEVTIVENLQREDLNPLEEAEGLARLQSMRSYTQIQLAKRVGKSQPAVANLLGINRLPDSIKEEYSTSNNQVSKGVLIELSKVKDSKEQLAMWEAIKSGGTVRQARRERHPAVTKAPAVKVKDVISAGRRFVKRLEESTAEAEVVYNQKQYDELVAMRERIEALLETARLDDAPDESEQQEEKA